MRTRNVFTLFGILLCLSLLLVPAKSNPVTPVLKTLIGIIHAHTNFDDGKWWVREWAKQGREQGLDYIILTPHATEVDNPIKELDAKIHYKGPVGYANFVKQCAENSTGGIQIIPGVEFGDAKDGNSHFLVLGLYDSKIFNEALKIYKKSGQKETLKFFDKLAYTTSSRIGHTYTIIAAHPDFNYRHIDPSSKVISSTKYQFNFDQVDSFNKGLNGLEVLNNGNVPSDTLEANLAHLTGRNLTMVNTAITGGCDFHTEEAERAAQINDAVVFHKKPFPVALNRQTVVWSPSKKPEDILTAIGNGLCGALYRKTEAFSPKELPQKFVEEDFSYFDSANPPATPVKYHVNDYFMVDVNTFMYCWYKMSQNLNGLPEDKGKPVRTLSRLPEKGYYPGQNEVILKDDLTERVQEYILVIDSPNYFLVTSPKIFWNYSMDVVD